MDEHEVLQHLLNLESKAAGLVTDAQAEADRRIAEGEKQNRARYDSIYSAEVAGLEDSYLQNITRVKQDYSTQLEEYLESLKAIPLDRASFVSLAEKLLFTAKAAQPAGNAE